LGTYTSGAEIKLFGFAIDSNRSRMDVRFKTAVRMLLGMADVLSEHRGFSTDIAFQGKYSFELLA